VAKISCPLFHVWLAAMPGYAALWPSGSNPKEVV